MPFILPARTLDSSYEIDNSLRFNDDDDPFLARTPSSSGSRTKATVSFWVKRGNVPSSSSMYILEASSSVSPFNMTRVRFGDNVLIIDNTLNGGADNGFYFQSTRFFRDPSAFYHIFFSLDLTQANAGAGWRLYVNGVQQTKAPTYFVQDANLEISQEDVEMNIGRRHDNGTEHFDGYLSEYHYIDGTIKEYTDFGEFNDNGVWIPKRYSGGSYGTNGFFLEMKQSGTGTNASGMGADTSGNTNHFAVSNLTATDVTTDTPTNNFATLNPLDVRQGATFSEGNCKIVTNSSNRNYVISTIGVTSGKWYCEAKITSGNTNAFLGVADFDDLLTNSASTLGDNSNEIGLNYEGTYQKNNSNNASWGGSYANNDIIGILLDMDNNRITYHKNGSYADGSGNFDESSPTAYISFTNSTMGFAFGDGAGAGTSTYELNFGNAPFTISSGNSDADGHGNFEFAVPSGYFALCTKNLAEYG